MISVAVAQNTFYTHGNYHSISMHNIGENIAVQSTRQSAEVAMKAEKQNNTIRRLIFITTILFISTKLLYTQIIIKDTVTITPKATLSPLQAQSEASDLTVTYTISLQCATPYPSAVRMLHHDPCTNSYILDESVPNNGTYTYTFPSVWSLTSISFFYYAWQVDGAAPLNYTIDGVFNATGETFHKEGVVPPRPIFGGGFNSGEISLAAPFTKLSVVYGAIEYSTVGLVKYNPAQISGGMDITGSYLATCAATGAWSPGVQPMNISITQGAEHVSFYNLATHALLGDNVSIMASEVQSLCIVADGENLEVSIPAEVTVTAGGLTAVDNFVIVPLQFYFRFTPPIVQAGTTAIVRINTIQVGQPWSWSKRVLAPLVTIGVQDTIPHGVKLLYLSDQSDTLQHDDTLYALAPDADFTNITHNRLEVHVPATYAGDTVAVRFFAYQTGDTNIVINPYLDPRRMEFLFADTIKGMGELIVAPAAPIVDHFEVAFERDTAAFTESSKIYVQAKDADNQNVELEPDQSVTLSIVTNTEYGTFIDKNNDTLKTTPVTLDHIPYGDAQAGLIQFSAVKENPIDPLLCKVKVELESDPIKIGEGEIPVVEQTLRIVMEGERKVEPRNLLGRRTPLPPSDVNKKEFKIQLTRNKAAVPNHSFVLTNDYIDGTGGHDHLTPRRDRNRDNYGWLILKRTNGDFDSPYNGQTQDDGKEQFDYVSSFFGDRMCLRVETTQPNKKQFLWDTLSFAEKVDGLTNFASITSDIWRLTGNVGTTSYRRCSGTVIHHPSNHFVTVNTSTQLQAAIRDFAEWSGSEEGGGEYLVLGINDMSLIERIPRRLRRGKNKHNLMV